MAYQPLSVVLVLMFLLACGSSEQVLTPQQVRLSTENDGLTVRSDFMVNTCGEPERLEVSEFSTMVEVRTVISVDRGDCEDIGLPAYDLANLDQPLGERQLKAVR